MAENQHGRVSIVLKWKKLATPILRNSQRNFVPQKVKKKISPTIPGMPASDICTTLGGHDHVQIFVDHTHIMDAFLGYRV